MFYNIFFLLVTAENVLEFHKKNQEMNELETKLHKEKYIDTVEFKAFVDFIRDINLECLDLCNQEIQCDETNCDIYMTKKVFNFCYFVFDNQSPLAPTLFKHVLRKNQNSLDNLILKLYFYFVNGQKIEKIFLRSDSVYDFFENKYFLGDLYDKAILKTITTKDESDQLGPSKYDPYMRFMYKIYRIEFNYAMDTIQKFKNQHIKLLSVLPKLVENETHFLMITKRRFIQGKKHIIEKSKNLKKVKKENVSYIQSEIIKKLIYFMDHRFSFEDVTYVEYFLYFLKYFCIKADLHITLVIEVLPGGNTKCQILSLDGTSIRNIMTYYAIIADKTEIITKDIKERIEDGRMHSFTTFGEQNSYSFDQNEGYSLGEQDCLLLSCHHYLGYESKEEWFKNFMQRCAYCHLYTTPIAYFKTEIFRVPEPTF